jgi:hypothetical protein
MNKFLVLVTFSILLFGCSAIKNDPEVVEVPDDVWQKVKKQTEERRKADEAKKKSIEALELEKLNRALDQAKFQDKKQKN